MTTTAPPFCTALSFEFLSFCRANGINDMDSARKLIGQQRTLALLPGHSIEVEKELRDLATGVFTPEPRTDPDLQEIALLFGLSVRAFNICDDNGLHCLSAIRSYFITQGSFLHLRNCGVKTDKELQGLIGATDAPGIADSGDDLSEAVPAALLESACRAHLAKLSTRSKNVLREEAGSLEVTAVLRFFLQQSSNMRKLPGAGSLVMRELSAMRWGLTNELDHVTRPPGHPALSQSTEEIWAMRHQVAPAEASILFGPHGDIHPLRFLQAYLPTTRMAQRLPVYMAYLVQGSTSDTMTEIADRLGLTRERVRQLTVRMDDDMPRHLALAADLPSIREHFHQLITDADHLILSNAIADQANAIEGTTWSPLFFAYLATALNDRRLPVVSWCELFDRTAPTRAMDHSHPLLLGTELIAPLRAACQRLQEHVDAKRGKELRLDMDALLDNPALARTAGPLFLTRLPELTMDGHTLVLPANAKRNQEDLLVEVLNALDTPSHAETIQVEWNKRFPDRQASVDSIRSVAIRRKDLFFSIGRSSTYGLTRWEKERPELRSGTIRDIVQDALKNSDTPIHLERITELVQRFRPGTTLSSIRQNILLDASGRFVILGCGYLGLSERNYAFIPPENARVPGSLFRKSVLQKFLGLDRSALTVFMAARCAAENDQVEKAIDKAIEKGRLLIDPSGRITGIGEALPATNEDHDSGEPDLF